ncbi:MAG TPA: alpha-xylosidase [Herpetosiphonaceae bacterium]|nr:alpha-xylosidase [Herpetosiphonaceae bacterium]
MKFTDGYWMMRDGVQAMFPAKAYDGEAADGALTVYAPVRRVGQRGDTLNTATLTARFSAPMPDVIRVRLSHFEGRRPRQPEFAIAEAPVGAEALATDGEFSLTSGRLSVRIPRGGDWSVSYLGDGRPLTGSGRKGAGIVSVAGAGDFIHEQLSLGVGEQVYGLGERFTAFVKNGQTIDTWNEDGGTGSEQAYKNIPFYLTNRGYGVFVNHPERVSFEVASEKVSRVQFSVAGQSLEYFVIYGPTPKEILARYTALTGRPALPPAWSFGLWLTTSFTTSYDEATVTAIIDGMAERGLPLHVFHFDCFWMREFHWCDFEWDPRTFPDPAGMLRRLKERGLRICVWINPYIAQRSALFGEGMAAGYLLKKPDGDVWQSDMWQSGMGLVDFSNPAARAWYAGKLKRLLDMGVDCFKTDFGERIPTDVAYFDGADPQRMHNYYAQLYNQTVFDLLVAERGAGEAVLFARSATAGGQQFPVHWGGDCESTFESMAESLRGGLSLGLSGFGFWSHDIGGFEGMPPAAVYKRWIAFGMLSSHSRLHGNSSYRVPWAYDEEAVAVLGHFTRLKCRLMPYLYAAAAEASASGVPVMRAMLLEFPDDPTCAFLDRQYMLGGSLLVAPVFGADDHISYYVPAGRWTHIVSGAVVEGPGWVSERHAMLSLPLLARPNSLIAVGANDQRPDYDYAAGLTIQIYELADGQAASASVPAADGAPAAAWTARREGKTITIRREGPSDDWRVLLVGIPRVAGAEGGSLGEHPLGALLTPDAGAGALVITLV